jgi:hypothetical protein
MMLPWVGEVRALTIGHNGKGPGPEWLLDTVEVMDGLRGTHYWFKAVENGSRGAPSAGGGAGCVWLGSKPDMQLSVTLPALRSDPRPDITGLVTYNVRSFGLGRSRLSTMDWRRFEHGRLSEAEVVVGAVSGVVLLGQ